jgi:TPR repeat protein
MDERENDTREKIAALKAALGGESSGEELYEQHRVAEVALDFRQSDEIAGLPPVDEELVEQLRALSLEALKRAAAAGHGEAAIGLARRVLQTEDSELAGAAWPTLTRLAPGDESGTLDVLLSYMWTRGLAGPDGSDGDEDEARTAAVRSAEKGNADGLFEAAVLVGRSDPEAGRAYNARAAALGQPRAMFNEGYYAETGDRVPQDDAVAFEWYRKAADLGHVKAGALVGIKCYQGRGHERDPAIITQYLGLAQNGGFPWASLAEVLAVSDEDIAEMRQIAGIEEDDYDPYGDEDEDEDEDEDD